MTEAYVSPYNIVPERETESSEADEDFKTPPETPIGSLESSR